MTKCAYCEYTDGMVYTSIPPKYKCTITKEFHLGDDDCNVKFEPVQHGRWEAIWHSIFKAYLPTCSKCGGVSPIKYKYCPYCGAMMDEVEE